MKRRPVWLRVPLWLAERLSEMIFPTVCIGCGRYLDRHEYDFCPECLEMARKLMLTSTFRVKHTDICFAPFVYTGVARQAILKYKFFDKAHYDNALAKYIGYAMVKLVGSLPDVITYVPGSDKRVRRRGYDQAYLLAHKLSKISGRPLVRALEKVRDNPKQSKLSASQRAGNVLGVYELTKEGYGLYGKRVLLVDDVVTTGATMSEAAKTLQRAEPAAVIGAAAAKTGKCRKKRLKLKQR